MTEHTDDWVLPGSEAILLSLQRQRTKENDYVTVNLADVCAALKNSGFRVIRDDPHPTIPAPARFVPVLSFMNDNGACTALVLEDEMVESLRAARYTIVAPDKK